MPRIMIEANLEDNVHWHNIFNPKDYILQDIGTAGMIIGKNKPGYSNLKMDFGQYCQLYEKTMNYMAPRSVGGNTLIPKNDRDLYYFVSLDTGRRNNANKWTILHVTESLIVRVDQLASDEGINEIVDGDILFEWKTGYPIILQPNYKEVIPSSNHTTND